MYTLKRCIHGLDLAQPGLIPLTRVSFTAVVRDSVASIDVSQTFRNVEKDPIECEYVFPILDDAAVTNLRVQTDDGAVLTATVEALEEAKETYTDAISEGNQAVMGRMETEDRMVVNVGNMAPRSQVVVTFRLVQPVRCEGKEWMFLLPAALIPLYNLSPSLSAIGLPADDDSSSDPVHLTFTRPKDCSYRFQFHLHIHASTPISNVRCPSHIVSITNDSPHLLAEVHTSNTSVIAPNKDFRVLFETQDAVVPQVRVQYDQASGEYAGMMSFIPPLLDQGEDPADLTGTGEFILVIDRSGSMQGARIEMARECLLLFLKSLPQPCKFNIISFGSNYRPMFESSVAYTDRSTAQAIKEIATFEADMNGTNIYSPLEAVLSAPPEPFLPKTVFLLTDGAVSNADAVVQLVETYSGSARVHTFGIGEGVSTFLVVNVAKAGNGMAEFIANPEEIKMKVIGVLQKSLAPALTGGKLQWPMECSTQFPPNTKISTCYFGEVFRVFALFGQSPPPLGSTLRFTAANSKTGSQVFFDVLIGPDMSEGEEIHQLWARQAIKYMTYQYKAEGSKAVLEEIVRISKRYGVPSLYTGFICVETRTNPVTGEMHLRKVPIVSTRLAESRRCPQPRSGAIRMFNMPTKSLGLSKAASYLCRTSAGPSTDGSSGRERSKEKSCPESACIKAEEFHSMAAACEMKNAKKKLRKSNIVPTQAVDPIMQLVQTQMIDGHWTVEGNEAALLGLPPPSDLISRLGPEADNVWATICIVLILQTRFASAEGEWTLVVGKAKRWLKTCGVTDLTTYTDLVAPLIVGR